jgi:bacillithiol system protein YtxJ
MHYNSLESALQLEQIINLSKNEDLKGVAIFKHSTRCSISSAAWSKLQRQWLWDDTNLPLYYLDLLQFRFISNQIAEDFSVEHQSPQILIIKDGKCVYTSSHNGILAAEIKSELFEVH